MKKITLQIAYTLVIILNIINIIFWVLIIYPFKVIHILDVRMISTEVRKGEIVEYEVDYCQCLDAPAVAHRRLVDHYVYSFIAETIHDKGKGCHTVRKIMPIPTYVDEGTYHIDSDLTYTLFGFREIQAEYKTPSFKVIPLHKKI